jgi:hypothetical protein
VLRVRRVPWNVLTDTWTVTAGLFRSLLVGKPPASSDTVVPFEQVQPEAKMAGRGSAGSRVGNGESKLNCAGRAAARKKSSGAPVGAGAAMLQWQLQLSRRCV